MSKSGSTDLLKITVGAWASRAVYVAAQLGLADQLLIGPRTATQLATESGTDAASLDRLLRFLVDLEVVDRTADGYVLGRLGEPLVTDTAGSMRSLVILYGEEFHEAWNALSHAIRTGESGFSHVFGEHMYDYFTAHASTTGPRFDRAMAAGNEFFGELPDAYDFTSAATVVDIAGGTGGLLAEVLRRNEGARGVLLEVGHVAERAHAAFAAAGLAQRCDVVDGDFRDDIPPGGDVYMLCRILHGRDDAACGELLKRCHAAMGTDSELLVLERIIPTDGTRSLAVWFDMHMLTVAGGWERTDEQYTALFAAAGLIAEEPRALSSDMNVIVVRRAQAAP